MSVRNEAKIGLLVLVGLAAAIVMVMMSDRFDFEPRYQIQVYLDNAEGLRRASPVTFAGLPVGEVLTVEQVMDPRGKVRAVAGIRQSRALPGDTEVRLTSNGFFGDSFLALSGGRAATVAPIAMDGSAVLVAKQGFLAETGDKAQRLIDGLNATIDDGTRRNLQRLIANGADFAGEGTALLRELRTTNARLVQSLEQVDAAVIGIASHGASTALRAEATLAAIERLVEAVAVRIEPLSASATDAAQAFATAARSAAAAADHLAAGGPDLRAALVATRDLARQAGVVASFLERGEGVLGQLLVSRELARDLHSVAVDAAAVAAEVAAHPSRLVFDADPAESAKDQAERDRRKQRRALGAWVTRSATTVPGAPAIP